MAKFESENRGVSWFSVSISPALRKAFQPLLALPATKRGITADKMVDSGLPLERKESMSGLESTVTPVVYGNNGNYLMEVRPQPGGQSVSAFQHHLAALHALQDTGVVPKLHGYDVTSARGSDHHMIQEDLRADGFTPFGEKKPEGYMGLNGRTKRNLGLIDPATVVQSAVSGLAKIHAAGYTHGDLRDKPDHMWMNGEGQVKFIDFGQSRKFDDKEAGGVGPLQGQAWDRAGVLKLLGDAFNGHPQQAAVTGMLSKVQAHMAANPADWHNPAKINALFPPAPQAAAPQAAAPQAAAPQAAAPQAAAPQNYNVQRLDSAPAAAPQNYNVQRLDSAPAAAPQAASPQAASPQAASPQAASPAAPQAQPFDLNNLGVRYGAPKRKSWFNVSLHNMFRKALPEGAEGMHPRKYWEEKRGFEFAGTVGKGMSGVARRLHNGDRSQDMILKVPHDADGQAETEMNKEIKALRALQGIPGVVKLHDSGFGSWSRVGHEEPGRAGYLHDLQPWTLTEDLSSTHVPLTSMKDLTPQKLAAIWRSAAMTYNGIHQRGYVHGDPKTDHIWIPKDYATSDEKLPRVKIMDFGNSTHKDDGPRATSEHDDHGGLAAVMLEKMGKGKEWEPLRQIAEDYPRSGPYDIQDYNPLFDKLDDIADPYEEPERVSGPAVQAPAPQIAPAAPQVTQTPAAPQVTQTPAAPQVTQTPAAPQVTQRPPAPQAQPFDLNNLGVRYGAPKRKSWFNVSLHNMFRKALPEERVIPEHGHPTGLGWRYDRELGEGMSGSTQLYTGEDGKRRVVKIPNTGFGNDLSKEESTLRRLQGIPGVPVLHGTGRNQRGQTAWIGIDHAEDDGFMSMKDLLSRGDIPISGKKLRRIWFKGAHLLDQIHEKGIAHGDLGSKPEHVYVHPETGEVKLIDFGNSTQDESLDGGKDHGNFENMLAAFYRKKTRLDKGNSSTEEKLNDPISFLPEDVEADIKHFNENYADADPFGKLALDELEKRDKQRKINQKNLTEYIRSSIKDGTHYRLADTEDEIEDGMKKVAPQVAPDVVRRPEPPVQTPAPDVVRRPEPEAESITTYPQGRIAPDDRKQGENMPHLKPYDSGALPAGIDLPEAGPPPAPEIRPPEPQVTPAPAPKVQQTPAPSAKPFDTDTLGVRYGSPKRR